MKDVTIRRGTLLLTPENTAVLGGQVGASLLAHDQVWLLCQHIDVCKLAT